MREYPRGLSASSADFAMVAKRGFEMSLTTSAITPVVPERLLRAATSGR